MDKLTACLEIASDSIKLLIGYELGGNPIVLYRKKKEIPGLIKEGQIPDPQGLVRALAELHSIVDDPAHIRIAVSEICFVLPPIGLTVYDSDKTTNVVSPTNEIAKIDISNVVSLVKKEAIPGDNEIVDIIPDEFILEDGRRFSNPPLGQKSPSLTIKAKIHSLPSKVPNTYSKLLTQAGFRIRRASVSTYCIAELFKTCPDLPSSYVLVDMGGRLTTVSLIGRGAPYSSASFFKGGDDLTEAIAASFETDFVNAEKVKTEFGYRETIHGYEPPLPLNDGVARENPFYQTHLNGVIATFFEGYEAVLGNAVSSLLSRYRGKYDSLPVVITGGASRLYGIRPFLEKALPGRELYLPLPRSIGARDAGFTALLGLLLNGDKYIGSLEDNYHGVSSVSRVGKEKKTARPQRGSNPDADAL